MEEEKAKREAEIAKYRAEQEAKIAEWKAEQDKLVAEGKIPAPPTYASTYPSTYAPYGSYYEPRPAYGAYYGSPTRYR
jgi:hypothetical protein